MLSSYSSPLNLGHKATEGFFDGGTYYVQEKIDGSQFSFGSRLVDLDMAETFCRSRGTQINVDDPGMFEKAVATVRNLTDSHVLVPGWTYRGEYVSKPKHNTLTYGTVPPGYIVLFDVDRGDQDYLQPNDVREVATKLGLYPASYLDICINIPTEEDIERWLANESCLGGCKVEGVVLKNYRVYGPDHKVQMVKIVSADFKEKHSETWKKDHPNRADVIDRIIRDYGSEARWQKAVQHLEEAGKVSGEPKDIGPLMKELTVDFETECAGEVAIILWNHFKKDIVRGIQNGFPEWYKMQLMKSVME